MSLRLERGMSDLNILMWIDGSNNCLADGEDLDFLQEKAYWADQRNEERLAAWKCHHCYNQAPRQEELPVLLELACSGWNLISNFSVPQRKPDCLFLESAKASKVGSARQMTNKRSNCIISIVLKHPCSHDNILTDLQHWQPGRWLIISSQ